MHGHGCRPYNGILFSLGLSLNLLAIDTSSRATVLGLQSGGEIIDRTRTVEKSHSREVLPAIDALLSEAGLVPAQLDAVVYGRGPGSFTGLRIAVGVVQGLCFGLDIPAVPVSSMACLAQSLSGKVAPDAHVLVALTARLEEIYFGIYRFSEDLAVEVIPEGVIDVSLLPGQSELRQHDWYGIGNAWSLKDKMSLALGISFIETRTADCPDVRNLLCIGASNFQNGQGIPASQAAPVYLREEVASRPGDR